MNNRANNVFGVSNDLARAATVREALVKPARALVEPMRFQPLCAERTSYGEEYRLNYGPDLDESLDGTESWHEFSAPVIRLIPY